MQFNNYKLLVFAVLLIITYCVCEDYSVFKALLGSDFLSPSSQTQFDNPTQFNSFNAIGYDKTSHSLIVSENPDRIKIIDIEKGTVKQIATCTNVAAITVDDNRNIYITSRNTTGPHIVQIPWYADANSYAADCNTIVLDYKFTRTGCTLASCDAIIPYNTLITTTNSVNTVYLVFGCNTGKSSIVKVINSNTAEVVVGATSNSISQRDGSATDCTDGAIHQYSRAQGFSTSNKKVIWAVSRNSTVVNSSVLRKIDLEQGTITTVKDLGARNYNIFSIYYFTANRLYWNVNGRIEFINLDDLSQDIQLLAGSGATSFGFPTISSPLNSTKLPSSKAMAFDKNNHLYYTADSFILKISAEGIMSRFIGAANKESVPVDGTGLAATISNSVGTAPDYKDSENLLVFELSNNNLLIRRVTTSSATVETVYTIKFPCQATMRTPVSVAYASGIKTYFMLYGGLFSWSPNDVESIKIYGQCLPSGLSAALGMIAVSPSGKYIVFSDRAGLVLYNLETESKKTITTNALRDIILTDTEVIMAVRYESKYILYSAPITSINNLTELVLFNSTSSLKLDYNTARVFPHYTAKGIFLMMCSRSRILYAVSFNSLQATRIAGGGAQVSSENPKDGFVLEAGTYGPIYDKDTTDTVLLADVGFLSTASRAPVIALKDRIYIGYKTGILQLVYKPTCSEKDGKVYSGRGTCIYDEVCSCKSGYIGESCETLDPNAPAESIECFGKFSSDRSVCSGGGKCTATDTCECFANDKQGYFKGNDCGTCLDGYGGLSCKEKKCFNKIASSVAACSGHGKCTSIDTCSCFSGYSGQECNQFSCYGISSTDASVCNGKKCVGNNECVCQAGFVEDCSYTYCYGVKSTNASVCSGQGSCSAINKCSCNQNVFGINCEFYRCGEYLSSDKRVCSGHGRCAGGNNCVCDSGYSGTNCETATCFGVQSTSPNVCSGHGRCVNSDRCECVSDNQNGFWAGESCASCQSNYQGASCKQLFCNTATTCNSKGTCNEDGTCTCSSSDATGYFAAPFCKKCRPNYFGADCKKYCKASETCSGHGTCNDSGDCECFNSLLQGLWTGVNCQTCQTEVYGSRCKTKKPKNFKFSDNGNSIRGSFETGVIEGATCESVVHPNDLAKLGRNPRCYFTTDSFIILFGSEPTFTTSDSIKLNVKFSDGSTEYITINVASPDNAPTPTASLTAPEQVSACAGVKLDGSKSSSGDGRALTYSWSVSATSDVSSLNTKLAGYTNSPIVRIESSDLTQGVAYQFSLTVTSFLGKSASASKTVTKSTSNVITVEFLRGASQTVSVGSYYRLDAVVRTSDCYPDSLKEFIFSFTQTTGESLSVRKFASSLSFDYLPKKEQTYGFSVTATSAGDSSITSTATMSFTTKLLPIEAAIYTTNVLSRDDTLLVFGYIRDPNWLDVAQTYIWSCVDLENGGECPEPLKTLKSQANLEFRPENGKIPAGRYRLELVVSKSSLTASTSTEISVVPGNLPVPRIYTSLKYPPTTRDLFIWSYIKNNYTSAEYYLNGDLLTSNAGNNLVISAGTLQSGTKYTLKLVATNSEGSAYSTMEFETNIGPQPGTLYVTPETGDPINTEYSMSGNQWSSPLGRTLYYRFTIIDPVSEKYISGTPWMTTNSLTIKGLPIPSGSDNKLQIKLVVSDFIEEVVLTKNVTVIPPNFSSEEEKNSAIRKQAESTRFLMGYATLSEFGVLVDSASSLFRAGLIYGRSLMEDIDQSNTTSPYNITSGLVDSIIRNHRQMKYEQVQLGPAYFRQISGNLKNILETGQVENTTLAAIVDNVEELVKDAATAWDSPVQLGPFSESYIELLNQLREETLVGAKKIINILRHLAPVSSSSELRTTHEYIVGGIKMLSTRLDTDTIVGDSIAKTIKFPDSIVQTLQDRNITTEFELQVVLYERNSSVLEYIESKRSKWVGKTVSVDLIHVVNGTMEILGIHELDGIEISIPAEIDLDLIDSPPGYRVVCKYYDEEIEEWVSKGLKVLNYTEKEVLCSSTHLSIFTATVEKNDCFGVDSEDNQVCGGHGTCVGQDTCDCAIGYSGERCNVSTTCFGIEYDLPEVCGGKGKCVDLDTCNCTSGYYSNDCSIFCTREANCSSSGKCSKSGECECDYGYTGESCDVQSIQCYGVSQQDLAVCSGHGTCSGPDNCTCISSNTTGLFTGYSCEQCYSDYFGSECLTTAPKSLRFSDSGLLITGERFYHGKASVSCQELIHNTDLILLGTNPDCTFDASLFIISTGLNATILPGDSIRINVNFDNSSLPTQYVSVFVDAALNATSPNAHLTAVETIYSCDGNILDASGSTSKDGRPLRYKWALLSGPNADNINSLLINSFASTLEIPNSLLAAGSNYSFAVTVSNAFNATATAWVSFRKSSASAIETSIVILPTSKLSLRSKTIVLDGKVSSSSECALSEYQIEWKQTGGDTVAYRTVRQSIIIDAFTLPVANSKYLFQFTATPISEPSLQSTTEAVVSIRLEDIVAKIRGGNGRFSNSSNIVLDASISVDPEESKETPTYQWSCLLSNKAECPQSVNSIIENSEISELQLPSGSIPIGSYVITMTISKGSRSASATTELEIVAANIPSVVFLKQPDAVVRSGGVIGYQALVVNEGTEFKWLLNGNEIDSAKATATYLTLRSSSLKPGQEYTVRLEHTNDDGVGFAQSTFTVNEPPQSGSISISPSDGVELDTLFEVSTPSWTDANTPLQYRYSFFMDGQLLGNYLSLEPSLKLRLPAGTVHVNASIYDSFQDYTVVSSSVTVLELQLNETAEVDKYNDLISTVEPDANGNIDVQQLGMIVDSITIRLTRKISVGRKVSDRLDMVAVVNKLVSLLDQAVSNIEANSPTSQGSLIQVVTNLWNILQTDYVSVTSQNLIANSIIEKCLNLTQSISDVNFDTNIATPLANIFTKLLVLNKNKSILISDYLYTLIHRLGKDLQFESSSLVDVEAFSLASRQTTGAKLISQVIPLSAIRSVDVVIESEVQSNALYVVSSYIVDRFTPYEYINSSSAVSPLFFVEVADELGQTISATVEFTTEAQINLQEIMDMNNVKEGGFYPQCLFLQEGVWESGICKLESFNSTTASCSCSKQGAYIVALEYHYPTPDGPPKDSDETEEAVTNPVRLGLGLGLGLGIPFVLLVLSILIVIVVAAIVGSAVGKAESAQRPDGIEMTSRDV